MIFSQAGIVGKKKLASFQKKKKGQTSTFLKIKGSRKVLHILQTRFGVISPNLVS